MKPLRDDVNSNDLEVANAARMLATIAPLAESEVRNARVLRAIHRKDSLVPSRWSRPLLAVLMVFGFAATAGAAWGISQWNSAESSLDKGAVDESQGSSASQASAVSPRPETGAISPSSSAPLNESSPNESTPTVLNTEDSGASKRVVPTTKQASSAPVSKGAKVVAQTGSPISEAALVQQAVEALRQSNNPGQAAALIKEYRKRAPSGALAEEALALSIEIALAQGSAQAKVYAKQYLKAYPSGRFRSLAQGALR